MTEETHAPQKVTFIQLVQPVRSILYLDMDGVLVNFVGGLCREFGISECDLIASHPKPLPWDLESLLGRPFAEIDAKLDEGFWFNLEPYPWADQLIDMASKIFKHRLFLCTSAGNAGTNFFNRAIVGKSLWIHKHYPQLADSLIVTFQKWQLAGYERILLDDCEDHVQQFIDNDGGAILFPQWWNSEWQRQESGDVLDFVKGKLKSLL